jgi:hypothetical protein
MVVKAKNKKLVDVFFLSSAISSEEMLHEDIAKKL